MLKDAELAKKKKKEINNVYKRMCWYINHPVGGNYSSIL